MAWGLRSRRVQSLVLKVIGDYKVPGSFVRSVLQAFFKAMFRTMLEDGVVYIPQMGYIKIYESRRSRPGRRNFTLRFHPNPSLLKAISREWSRPIQVQVVPPQSQDANRLQSVSSQGSAASVDGTASQGSSVPAEGAPEAYFYDHQHGVIRAKLRTRPSKAQKQLFEDVRRWAQGHPVYQELIFPWSIGPHGAGYRYDIGIPSLKILVEYDSKLHRKFNKHFHKTKLGFMDVQLRDSIKDVLARKNGYILIRVKEGSPEGALNARRAIEQSAGTKNKDNGRP